MSHCCLVKQNNSKQLEMILRKKERSLEISFEIFLEHIFMSAFDVLWVQREREREGERMLRNVEQGIELKFQCQGRDKNLIHFGIKERERLINPFSSVGSKRHGSEFG